MSATGYKRVRVRNGAWHFTDKHNKSHKLARLDEGEAAMLRALARFRDAPEARPGSMPALIALFRAEELPAYAASTRYDYGLMLDHIAAALRDHDVAAVDAGTVLDLRDQWLDKPRSAARLASYPRNRMIIQGTDAILEAAAAKLERDGWCQHEQGGRQGPNCVLGAIGWMHGGGGWVLGTPAERALAIALGACVDNPFPVALWNNDPSRTKEEVCAMLRAVAASERARVKMAEESTL